MDLCAVCGNPVEARKRNYTRKKICNSCMERDLLSHYHLDTFEIVDGRVVRHVPLEGRDQTYQRSAFIDFAYTLFKKGLNGRAYKLTKEYVEEKGYTYLGMIRALEWFYLIKKNDRKKAGNSIAIIPHVYEEANKYYNYFSNQTYQKYIAHIRNAREAEEKTKLSGKGIGQRKNSEIDMESL